MERRDFEKVIEWTDDDIFDTTLYLGNKLRDLELYPKQTLRREEISKKMSLVCFEQYQRYNEAL